MKTTTTLFSAIIVNPADSFPGLTGKININIHMDKFRINDMSVKSVIHADCGISGNLEFNLKHSRITDEMFYFEVYSDNTLHICNVGTFDYIGGII